MSDTSSDAVHPRLRGELKDSEEVPMTVNGSSPLTRGTHLNIFFLNIRIRFIPAYAGNSVVLAGSAIDSAVHPRLRGELERSKRN